MSENTNALKNLQISAEVFALNSVSKLADRPNAPSRLGESNLTAEKLKEKFDANPDLIRISLNRLIDSLINGEFAKDVKIDWGSEGTEIATLSQFFAAILSGVLSEKYLKAKRNANSDVATIDSILAELDRDISKIHRIETVTADMPRSLNAEEYTKTGRWYFHFLRDGTQWEKMPEDCVNGWLETFQSPTTATICNQIFHNASSVDKFYEIYTRTRSSTGEWSDWRRLATAEEVEQTLGEAKKYVADKISAIKLIKSVEDYTNEATGKVHLKITFESGDVLDDELDNIFSGVDNLLAEKADKAEVEAVSERITNFYVAANERINLVNEDVANVNKRVDKVEGMLVNHLGDTSEAYIKNVPANAAPKAMLNRVGGKTIKKHSGNLCTLAVKEGIPFYIPYGTDLWTCTFYLPAGTYSYYDKLESYNSRHVTGMLKVTWDGPSKTFTLDKDSLISYEIRTTNTDMMPSSGYQGYLFLRIVEGTEIPTEYEPHEAPSLEPTKVTEIVSRGQDLIPTPYIAGLYGGIMSKEEGYEKTAYGVFWKINSYGNITADGTATANSYLTIQYDYYLPAGDYVLSGCPAGGGSTKYALAINNVDYGEMICVDYGNGVKFRSNGNESMRVYAVVFRNCTVNNIVFKPRISIFNERYPIPDEIQAMPRYGEGIGRYYSYIDFDRQKFLSAEMVDVVFDGTERWSYYNGCFNLRVDLPLRYESYTKKPAALCTHFDVLSLADWYGGKRGVAYENGYVRIRCSEYTSVADFTDFLLLHYRTANPLTIRVPTRTFEEHDISEILKKDEHFGKFSNYTLIDVAQNGEVIAENVDKNPVPWTVTFAEV